MILIDRQGKEHRNNIMLIKDILNLRTDIYRACDLLLLDELKSFINHQENNSTIEDSLEAINKLLPYITDSEKNFDIVMMKQALTWFIGQKVQYDKVQSKNIESVPFAQKVAMQVNLCKILQERRRALDSLSGIEYKKGMVEVKLIAEMIKQLGDDNMIDKLEVGIIITDRNGKEFKAYSSLLTEYKESLELLAKVDIVDISQNIDDTEAQDALLEIIYRALNKAVTKKKILKSLDAEFARKCIKVYYDLPIAG